MSSPPIKKAKWIAGAAPDQPVAETARLALGCRLDLVCYYLPLAAERWQEDVEYVHQLRVTSRRSVAAVDIFGHLLGERRRRWLRRRLGKIRRAAGDARDFDVQLARLEAWAGDHPDRDVTPVADWLSERRRLAQAAIVTRQQRLAGKDFDGRVRRLVERVGMKARPKRLAQVSFATAARGALPPIADRFFAAGDDIRADEIDSLHRFRIEGKRLRYAIELLAAAFGPELCNEVYPVVESLQEKLGTVNDHATAAARYREWAATTDCTAGDVPVPLLLDWAAEEDVALATTQAEFADWWTDARAKQLRQQLGSTRGDQ
jgi:CHAD domain-containing protein